MGRAPVDERQDQQSAHTSLEDGRTTVPSDLCQEIVGGSLVGFYVAGADGLVYINDRGAAILGRDPEELKKGDPFRFLPEPVRGEFRQQFSQRLAGEWHGVETEFPFEDAQGEVRWIEATARRTEWDGRTVVAGTLVDRTEVRKAKDRIAEQEGWFRTLIEQAFDAVLVMGGDGTIRYTSPTVERILGYTRPDREGHDVLEHTHPDDIETLEGLLREARDIQTDRPARGVVRKKHADGTWRVLDVAVRNLLEDPVVAGIVINYRDITERAKAEEAQAQLEAQFQEVFEAAPIGLILDDARKGRWVNRAAAELLGQSAATVEREGAEPFLGDPEDGEALGPNQVEIATDSGARWAERLTGEVASGPDAEPLRFTFLRDITAMKDSKARLRRRVTQETLAAEIARNALSMETAEEDAFSEMLNRACARVRDALGVPHAAVIGRAGDTLRSLASCGWDDYETPDDIPVDGNSHVGRAMVESRPMVVEALEEKEGAWTRRLWKMGVRSGIAVPLTSQRGSEGALAVHDRKPREWSESDVQLVESVAAVLGLALEHRAAQQELEQSEIEYRRMLENAWDAITVLGPEGTVVWANAAVQRHLGYTPDEMVGMEATEFIHPEDRARAAEALAAAFDEGHPPIDVRIIHKDGTVRDHWLSGRAYQTAREEPRLVVNTRDVTDEKRAAEAVEASAEQYRSLAELSPDAILVLQDGRFVYANQEAQNLLGAETPADVLGRGPLDFVPTEYHQLIEDRLETVRADAEPTKRLEYQWLDVDGEPIDVEANSSPTVWNGRDAIQIIGRDIAERKRTDQALRASQERFQGIVSLAADAIISTDAEQRITLFNEAAEQVFGYKAPEIIGEPLDTLVPAEQRQSHRQDVEAFAREGAGARPMREGRTVEAVRKDGTRVPVEVSLSRLHLDGETINTAVIRDVTERREAERALRESEARYRSLMETAFAGIAISQDGQFVEVTEQFAGSFGYRPEEVEGRPVIDLVAPREKGRVESQIEAEVEEIYETMALRKDGTEFPAETVSRMVPYEGGRARLTAVRDISDRREAEEALQKSEARYRRLVEKSPDAIIVDVDRVVRFANQAAADLFHLEDPEGMIGLSLDDLGQSEDETERSHERSEQLAQGDDLEGLQRTSIVAADGAQVEVEFRPIAIEYEGTHAVMSFLRDVTQRVEAEQALRESEERYRDLFESAPVGIFTTHSEGRVLASNQHLAEMLGFDDVGEAVDHYPDLAEHLYADSENRAEFLSRLTEQGAVENFEYEAVRRDGRHIWVEMDARISRQMEDGTFEIEGFAREITERKQAERVTTGQREILQRIVEGVPLEDTLRELGRLLEETGPDAKVAGCFIVLDENGQPRFRASAYPEIEAAVGCPAAVLKGEERATGNVVEDETWPTDLAATRAPLALRAAHARPIRDPRGDVLGAMCVFGESPDALEAIDQPLVDIIAHTAAIAMARERATRSLRQATAHLENVIESAPVAIITYDRRGRVKTWNPAAEDLFGVHEDEVEGLPFPLMPEQPMEQQRLMEAVLDGESRTGLEVNHSRRDGSPRVLSLTLAPLSANGSGILAMARDRTEEKRAEAMEEQLRDAERLTMLGEMAASVSHEVNNPLSAIMAIGYGLLHDPSRQLDDRARKDVKQIEEEASRAAQIMKDLLKFTRIPTGTGTRTPLQINEIVEQALTTRRYTLKTSTVEVKENLGDDLPLVSVEGRQMTQVLMNLINNAEQAMRAQGEGTLAVQTRVRGGTVQVIVEDTGPGIPEDSLEKIFEPMFTTKASGNGLGLSVSRQIVEAHGGRIWAENTEAGARFTMELPPQEASVDEAPESASRSTVDADGGRAARRGETRVLVVDDEGYLRQSLYRALAGAGYEVDEAEEGAEALDMMMTDTYDIAVVDIRMPKMNGMTLYRMARKLSDEQRPDFVFMTGDALAGDTAEFLAQSGAPYLTKPFPPPELIRLLDENL